MLVKTKNFAGGFTLIELILVMAIIGFLAGLIIVGYPSVQKRARDTRRMNDIKQYQQALEMYMNRNNSYPAVSGNVVNYCSTLNLTSCPDDPNPSFHYLINSTASPSQYVVWARLEYPSNPVTYFIACSNGKTGSHTVQPTSSNCTLP